MQGSRERRDYLKRLQRVIDYIYDHLDEELDFLRLAEVACLSPYHWHRVYHAMMGETAAGTVKRLRLHRACAEVVAGDLALEVIARRAGYSGVAPFSRAFKAAFGLPPARYRREGSHRRFQTKGEERPMSAKLNPVAYDVTVRRTPAMTLACLPHRGSYLEIGQAFDRLFGLLAARGLLKDEPRSIGVYYDDPDAVAEAELRSHAGAVLADPTEAARKPFEAVTLPETDCAILRHKGPYADLHLAYGWLFGEWLPGSGREAADLPAFEEYLNDPRQVPPSELLTDICLPLKS